MSEKTAPSADNWISGMISGMAEDSQRFSFRTPECHQRKWCTLSAESWSCFVAQNSGNILPIALGKSRLHDPSGAGNPGLMESKMVRKLLLTLPLLVIPGVARAEMGGGTDRDRVNLQVEAMMRDGRWERAVAEGRANRQAFEALRQAQARFSQPATRYTASDGTGRRARN